MMASSSNELPPYPCSLRLRDCPHHLLDTISLMLHDRPTGGCGHLAGKLNYTVEQVDNVATLARAQGFVPCRLMLMDWQKQDGSTLDALETALRDIKRLDVINKMREIMTEKSTIVCSIETLDRQRVRKTAICGPKDTLEDLASRLSPYSRANLVVTGPKDECLAWSTEVKGGRTYTFKERSKKVDVGILANADSIDRNSRPHSSPRSRPSPVSGLPNPPVASVPPFQPKTMSPGYSNFPLNLQEDNEDRETTYKIPVQEEELYDEAASVHFPGSLQGSSFRPSESFHLHLDVQAGTTNTSSHSQTPTADVRADPVPSANSNRTLRPGVYITNTEPLDKSQFTSKSPYPSAAKFPEAVSGQPRPQDAQTKHNTQLNSLRDAMTRHQTDKPAPLDAPAKDDSSSIYMDKRSQNGGVAGHIKRPADQGSMPNSDFMQGSPNKANGTAADDQKTVWPQHPARARAQDVTQRRSQEQDERRRKSQEDVRPKTRRHGQMQGTPGAAGGLAALQQPGDPSSESVYEHLVRPSPRPLEGIELYKTIVQSIPPTTPGWYPNFPDRHRKRKVKKMLEPYLHEDGAYLFRPHEDIIGNVGKKTIMVTVTSNRDYRHFVIHWHTVTNAHKFTVHFYRGSKVTHNVVELMQHYRDNDLVDPKKPRDQQTPVRLLRPVEVAIPN